MITQWMVRMTCAIALLFVGFAHQAPSFAKGALVPAEFAEYVLPDGTLPVVCMANKTDKMHRHDKAKVHGCEACRIGASVLLRVPDGDQSIDLPVAIAAAQPYDADVSPRRTLPPNMGPRAPPRDSASA